MKFLDMELCRQHLRIEDEEFCEQESLIRHYAESAEDLVLNWIERSYEDVVAEYGEFPSNLVQAALLVLAQNYEQRSSITMQQVYLLPVGNFDALCINYMK